MMKRLVNLFLLGFFYSAPVYAVTIVDVSEDSKVVDLEYISDCEWIERIEIHTTTTYRDFVGGDFTPPRYNGVSLHSLAIMRGSTILAFQSLRMKIP